MLVVTLVIGLALAWVLVLLVAVLWDLRRDLQYYKNESMVDKHR